MRTVSCSSKSGVPLHFHVVIVGVVVSLLIVSAARAQCTDVNPYATTSEGLDRCKALIASGTYSCDESFAVGKRYVGHCDFSCGHCDGSSESTATLLGTRMLQESDCVAHALSIVEEATETIRGLESADVPAASAGVASAEWIAGFTTEPWLVLSSDDVAAKTCALWHGMYQMSGGAAVYIRGGELSVTGASFVGNRAVATATLGFGAGGGAAIALDGGKVNVTGTSFLGNAAPKGGAVLAKNFGEVYVMGSSFVGNTAYSYGGAIYVDSFGKVNVAATSFTGNTASAYGVEGFIGDAIDGACGGAIYVNLRHVIVNAASFVGNTAASTGGAICADGGELSVTDTVFVDNGVEDNATLSGGNHVSVSGYPARFYIYNTSFDPFEPDSDNPVGHYVLAGCDQHPCDPNGATFSSDMQISGMQNAASCAAHAQSIVEKAEVAIAEWYSSHHGSSTIDPVRSQTYGYRDDIPGAATGVADAEWISGFTMSEPGCNAGMSYPNHNVRLCEPRLVIGSSDVATKMCALWYDNSDQDVDGAAIYVSGGELSVMGSSFVGNGRSGCHSDGGAISLAGGELRVTTSSFVGNEACSGGAIMVEGGELRVTGTSFVGNNGGSYGGAIYVAGGDASVLGASFVENTASSGGAVNVAGGELRVAAASFVRNLADGFQMPGGAIYAGNNGYPLRIVPFQLSVSDSSFVDNIAPESIGDHIFGNSPPRFYIYNTSFEPFESDTDDSVSLNVLAGCDKYPCNPSNGYSTGFSCSYRNYSLLCEPCSMNLISTDGLSCFPCGPGEGSNDNQTLCEPCQGFDYSPAGTCMECAYPNIVNLDRTTCSACSPGKQPNANRTACVACLNDTVSTFGVCVPCGAGKVPNGARISCEPCPVGQSPSTDGSTCVCSSGWYHYSHVASSDGVLMSFDNPIVCHEGSNMYDGASQLPPLGCTRCGHCVDCKSAVPQIKTSYVRILGRQSDARRALQAGARSIAPITIFRCIYDTGCFADRQIDLELGGCKTCEEKSLPLTTACQATYTGHFCSQCDDGYEAVEAPAAESFECVRCAESQDLEGLITALVLVAILLLVAMRRKLLWVCKVARKRAVIIQAGYMSIWQPIRIVITYGQVVSEIGSVLEFAAPEATKRIFSRIASFLSVTDVVVSAKCFGIDSFHYKWRLHVVIIPVLMLSIPLIVWTVGRKTDSEAALVGLTKQAFFVCFFCYPQICRYCFDALIAHPIAPGAHVLIADDRVLYEDAIHQPYIFASYGIIVTFCFGVPVGAAALVWNEYRQLPRVSSTVVARLSEALRISSDEAEAVVDGVLKEGKYGVLTGAFKPKFYANESLDMLRKLILIGIIAIGFDRGSVAQAVVSLSVAVLFLTLQVRNWPYKMEWDNRLRMLTEAHVCLTIAVALAFRSDLDSLLGPAFGPDDPEAIRLYLIDIYDKKTPYDQILLGTFIVCVPVAFVATCVEKMRLVAKVLGSSGTKMSGASDRDIEMKLLYERFRLGLVGAAEIDELASYVEDLKVENDHERAGRLLWRTKEYAAHLGSVEMRALLETLEQDLPASQQLGFHYTTLDNARQALEGLGVKASSEGQLGGGVSVCLATPVDFGWDKFGSYDFAKACGEELWGSKWYEVMPKPAPKDAHVDWGKWAKKLEVVLILRIPTAEHRDPRRVVPGRPNVFIIPSSDCVAGADGDKLSYYSNTNIVKVLILKPPEAGSAGAQPLGDLVCKGETQQVRIESNRDSLGGMIDVAFSIVQAESFCGRDVITGKTNNPTKPWRWTVTRTPAFITVQRDHATLYLDRHRRLQNANLAKKLWPENVARFTPDEMAAALYSIDQRQLRSYTLAFLYTTTAQAVEMCQKGSGIASSCTVTTLSPVDLDWEKNAGGRFKEVASEALGQDPDSLQAVLVLGLPVTTVQAQASHSFTIPTELLMEVGGANAGNVDMERTYVYANAHVHKSYILTAQSEAKQATLSSRGATTDDIGSTGSAKERGSSVVSLIPQPEPEPELGETGQATLALMQNDATRVNQGLAEQHALSDARYAKKVADKRLHRGLGEGDFARRSKVAIVQAATPAAAGNGATLAKVAHEERLVIQEQLEAAHTKSRAHYAKKVAAKRLGRGRTIGDFARRSGVAEERSRCKDCTQWLSSQFQAVCCCCKRTSPVVPLETV